VSSTVVIEVKCSEPHHLLCWWCQSRTGGRPAFHSVFVLLCSYRWVVVKRLTLKTSI